LRKPFVAGNWKMNGELASVQELVTGILQGLATRPATDCEICLFPAYVHLIPVVSMVGGRGIAIGAQDVDVRNNGPATGSVSAQMISDAGCTFFLCGHSERRKYFGETNQMIAEKFEVGLAAGLTPILCIGESEVEREAGHTLAVLSSQVDAVINRVGVGGMRRGLVAYEPVWAIGSGNSATATQAGEVHAALRERFSEQSLELAESVRILYGGSVSVENSTELFADENVDGFLLGGAALSSKSFLNICRVADASLR